MPFSFFRKLMSGSDPTPKRLANSEDATLVLLELFQGHGLPCRLVDGWVKAESGNIEAQARVFLHQHQASVGCQLDCEIKLPDGRRIIESCADGGKDVHEAIGNAVRNFCLGSFHVVLSALTGLGCGHCQQEDWEVGGRLRRVYISFLSARFIDGQSELAFDWCDAVFAALRSQDVPNGLHWFRFFHGNWPGAESSENEALFDNEPSQSLIMSLVAFNWAGAPISRTLRLFIIVADMPDKI